MPRARPATQAQILGELGVMYRHSNDFVKALQTFNKQFQLASEMGTQEGEIEMCRAIGNEGMSAYNLSQQQAPQDEKLRQTAIRQLRERIDRAQTLHDRLVREDPGSRYVGVSHSWKVIGMDRLTLCYVAAGKTAEAVHLPKSHKRFKSTSNRQLEPSPASSTAMLCGAMVNMPKPFNNGVLSRVHAVLPQPFARSPRQSMQIILSDLRKLKLISALTTSKVSVH